MAGALKKVEAMPEQNELELVEQLKQKHKLERVYGLTANEVTVYVRVPAPAVWRRFRSQMQDARKRDEAGELLLKACLLHPDATAFDAMLESSPGLLDTFASELAELAGLHKDVEKKVF